jgi:hypothetical protein
LSVAFIDEDYKIINIHKMQPYDETPHCSIQPAKYALEMQSGWFITKQITAGHKVFGILN